MHSIPEPLWRKEIKQVEKLLQVVLERCSREQQFVLQAIVVQDPEKLQNKKASKKKELCSAKMSLSV